MRRLDAAKLRREKDTLGRLGRRDPREPLRPTGRHPATRPPEPRQETRAAFRLPQGRCHGGQPPGPTGIQTGLHSPNPLHEKEAVFLPPLSPVQISDQFLLRTGKESVDHMDRRIGAFALLCATSVLSQGCAVSLQEEVDLGREYARQINAQVPLVDDPEVRVYVERLGTTIARHADPRKLEYHFFVVNSDVVNAFALPGGFVYVNRGLIEKARTMSEVAGVMGHEIGHVVARHSVEQMQKAQAANLGLSIGYILLGRAPTTAERVAIDVTGGLVFMKFSRDAEREADSLAVGFLVKSGIDPRGLPRMFEVLLQERERRPGLLEQWFSSHPLTEDRIHETDRIIEALPSEQLRGLQEDSPTFRRIQDRLRNLPPPPQGDRR